MGDLDEMAAAKRRALRRKATSTLHPPHPARLLHATKPPKMLDCGTSTAPSLYGCDAAFLFLCPSACSEGTSDNSRNRIYSIFCTSKRA